MPNEKSLKCEERGFTALNIRQRRQQSENRLFESCGVWTCQFLTITCLRSVFSRSVFKYLFEEIMSFNRFRELPNRCRKL